MKNDFQISDDGTIFQIKEDGTISKLGRIENGRIVPSVVQESESSNHSSGKAFLIFFLVVFAIATIAFAKLYSEANNKYQEAIRREYALEKKISTLEFELVHSRIANTIQPSNRFQINQGELDQTISSAPTNRSALRSELEAADIEELREAYSERGGTNQNVMASKELLIQALEKLLD